jgi:hypothetical protein
MKVRFWKEQKRRAMRQPDELTRQQGETSDAADLAILRKFLRPSPTGKTLQSAYSFS